MRAWIAIVVVALADDINSKSVERLYERAEQAREEKQPCPQVTISERAWKRSSDASRTQAHPGGHSVCRGCALPSARCPTGALRAP
jgi:ferredoxin